MREVYNRLVRPGYFHGLRVARALLWPLLGAAGLSFLAREILSAPMWVVVVVWLVGAGIGFFAWWDSYTDEPDRSRR